jgi:tetratricopeptide (TPR) repeat protein
MQLFTRLVRLAPPNQEGTDTRQRLPLHRLGSQARPVAEAFVSARLLVIGRDESLDEETIELAHEALMRDWDRLSRVLAGDRPFLLWRQHLNLLVSEWDRGTGGSGPLLRSDALEEARRWARDRQADLDDIEHTFIKASERMGHRSRLWLVVAAITGIIALLALTAWSLWTRSNAYQIRLLVSDAMPLPALADATAVDEWVRSLVLSGHVDEALATASTAKGLERQRYEIALGTLVALGRVNDAIAAAGRIHYSYQLLSDVFVSVDTVSWVHALNARSELTMGDIRAARAAALRIHDSVERDETLVQIMENLQRSGSLPEALSMAQEINDGDRRYLALKAVAEAFTNAGQLDQATTVSEEALKVVRKSDNIFFTHALLSLVRVGKTREALEAARSIRDPQFRSYVLVSIAEALLPTQADQADPILTDALTALRKASNAEPSSFAAIAEDMAKANMTENAFAIARSVQAPFYRHRALLVIARAFANTSHPDKAAEALDGALEAIHTSNIRDPDYQCEALLHVGQALVEMGMTKQAHAVAEEALTAARRFRVEHRINNQLWPSNWSSFGSPTQAFVEVAKVLVTLGDVRTALAIPEELEANERPNAFLEITKQVIAFRGAEATLAVVHETKDYRVEALTAAAKALVAADQTETALAATRGMTDPFERSATLAAIGEAIATAGDRQKALRVAKLIEMPFDRAETLAVIAMASAHAEDLNLALVAAREALASAQEVGFASIEGWFLVDREAKQSLAFTAAAKALLEAGQLEDAAATANRIDNLEDRSRILAAVAEGLAKAGRAEEARREAEDALLSAQQITEDPSRSRAFARVARAMAESESFWLARKTADRCALSTDRLHAYAGILATYALKTSLRSRGGRVLPCLSPQSISKDTSPLCYTRLDSNPFSEGDRVW